MVCYIFTFFSKFLLLGQELFSLLSNEIHLTICACHCINSILKLLCISLQHLLFAMFIFRKKTFERLQLLMMFKDNYTV